MLDNWPRCVRKGSKEKILGYVQLLIKADTARWGGKGHWQDRGSGILHINECIPDPPASVFGEVPELSVSSKTPSPRGVHLLEGAMGGRGGRLGLLELTEGGPSRTAEFSSVRGSENHKLAAKSAGKWK